jgi:hypothetical protein
MFLQNLLPYFLLVKLVEMHNPRNHKLPRHKEAKPKWGELREKDNERGK